MRTIVRRLGWDFNPSPVTALASTLTTRLRGRTFLGIAGARLFQAGSPSCHPTNSVKVLKKYRYMAH